VGRWLVPISTVCSDGQDLPLAGTGVLIEMEIAPGQFGHVRRMGAKEKNLQIGPDLLSSAIQLPSAEPYRIFGKDRIYDVGSNSSQDNENGAVSFAVAETG